MITIGIDPGISGAFVAMFPDGTIEWRFMPKRVTGTKITKKKNNLVKIYEVDVIGVRRTMYDVSRRLGVKHVTMEKVGAYSGFPPQSAFTFGRNVMAVEAVLRLYGYSYELVEPKVWQKFCGLVKPKGPDGKVVKNFKPSVPYVLKKYSHIDFSKLTKAKLEAVCDTICIAEYGDQL